MQKSSEMLRKLSLRGVLIPIASPLNNTDNDAREALVSHVLKAL